VILVVLSAAVLAIVGWDTWRRSQAQGPMSPSSLSADATRAAPLPDLPTVAIDATRPGDANADEGGRSHDRLGAREAALDLVKASERLVVMELPDALAAQRSVSAAASADALVEQLRAELGPLRRVWPAGSLTYRVAPLAVRVVEDGPDAARAEVWCVGVVAGRDLATYEEWLTVSYRLVWEGDDWRLAARSESPGPRPDPGRQSPATPAELEARLARFEAVP
jgi:hypothetical protein